MLDNKYSTYIDGKFVEVATVDEICNSIRERIESANNRADRAQEEMQKMKDEKWKDTELQEMKAQMEEAKADMRRGFSISKSELEKIRAWENQHWTNQHQALTNEARLRKMGAIGGSFTYEFNPTSIGTFGTIYCNSCMAKVRRQTYKDLFDAEASRQKFNYNNRLRELIKEYDAEFAFRNDL